MPMYKQSVQAPPIQVQNLHNTAANARCVAETEHGWHMCLALHLSFIDLAIPSEVPGCCSESLPVLLLTDILPSQPARLAPIAPIELYCTGQQVHNCFPCTGPTFARIFLFLASDTILNAHSSLTIAHSRDPSMRPAGGGGCRVHAGGAAACREGGRLHVHDSACMSCWKSSRV